jgi:DNA-binding XRE family transcriptional regulator
VAVVMQAVELSDYPSRKWTSKVRHKYVATLLARLDDLERRSHPDGGSKSAKGKDLAAFEALETAGELVRAVAGWAIDHQAGLALMGLSFVPLQPSQTKKHPAYQEQRRAVDDHRHESNGAKLVHTIREPRAARRMLLNLLQANVGAFPYALVAPVIEAIEGLEFGEQSPMFTAIKAGRKAGLRELRLQLRAIAFIAYRRAQGITKLRATEDVAKAFGVSRETVVSWEKRLHPAFGQLEVSRTIAFAKNHANYGRETMFGENALKTTGEKYQAILRHVKAATHTGGVRA